MNQTRSRRLLLLLGTVLVLGLAAYGWLSQVLVNSNGAWLLVVCVILLVAILLWVSHREQIAWAQLQVLQQELTDLHTREKLLETQAHHDGLTGLVNRLLLADRFQFAQERAKISGRSFALLMIDLNDFKSINDNYGHAAGDMILVTTAKRLVGTVRASDTVARLGGDEFLLIIESIDDPQVLLRVGQKLIDTLSNPITLDSGAVINISASAGLAVYPQQGSDMSVLLQMADLAMYECKLSGRMCLK